jgi:hypothetical protein
VKRFIRFALLAAGAIVALCAIALIGLNLYVIAGDTSKDSGNLASDLAPSRISTPSRNALGTIDEMESASRKLGWATQATSTAKSISPPRQFCFAFAPLAHHEGFLAGADSSVAAKRGWQVEIAW